MDTNVIIERIAPVLHKTALVDCKDLSSITPQELLIGFSPDELEKLTATGYKQFQKAWVSKVLNAVKIQSKKPAYRGEIDEKAVIAFVILVGTTAKVFKLTADDFANMDESGITLAQAFLRLYALGNKRAQLFKLSHLKSRFTVAVGGTAAGRKLTPYIICDNTPVEYDRQVVSVDSDTNVFDFAREIVIDRETRKIKSVDNPQNEQSSKLSSSQSLQVANTSAQHETNQSDTSDAQEEIEEILENILEDEDETVDNLQNSADNSDEIPVNGLPETMPKETELDLFDEAEEDERLSPDLRHLDMEAIVQSLSEATSILQKAIDLHNLTPQTSGNRPKRGISLRKTGNCCYLSFNSPLMPFVEEILQQETYKLFLDSFREARAMLLLLNGIKPPEPVVHDEIFQNYLDNMLIGPESEVAEVHRAIPKFDTIDKYRAYAIALLQDEYIRDLFLHSDVAFQSVLSEAWVARQHKAWMDTQRFIDYVQYLSQNPSKPRVLIMDNCPSHVSKDSRTCLGQAPMLTILLPKNATDRFQPMDLAVNAPLKAKMRTLTLNRYNFCILRNISGKNASYLYKWTRTIANFMYAWNAVKPQSVQNGFRKMFRELESYFGIQPESAVQNVPENVPHNSRKNAYWRHIDESGH